MDKIFNVEIDGQVTLPDGSTLGPLEETTVNVVQPSEGGGYDSISDGNITEVDGKKVLTPLGGGILYNHKEFVSGEIYPAQYGEPSGSYDRFGDYDYIDTPEVGKKYNVTVNGVVGEYTCFLDEDGYACLGTPYDEIVSDGQWLITFFGDGSPHVDMLLTNEGAYLSFVFSGEFKEYKRADINMLPLLPVLFVDLDGFDLSNTTDMQDVPVYTAETFGKRSSLTQKQVAAYLSRSGGYAIIIDFLYNSFAVTDFNTSGLNILRKKYNGPMEYIFVTFSFPDAESDSLVQASVVESLSYKDSSTWTNV